MGKSYSYAEVVAHRKVNPEAAWHLDDDPRTAAARLRSGEFLRVAVKPKFLIPRAAKVFTIGSCFARNAERVLHNLGMEVPAASFSVPPEYYRNPASPAGVLNKYNTHSIEGEVLTALGELHYPNEGFIDAGDGRWWDPLTTSMKPMDLETVRAVRKSIRQITESLFDCDAVLITLGLNELVRDRETGVYMNEMPPAPIVRKHREKLEWRLCDFEENFGSIDRTVGAIHKHNPKAKVIVTVSPVPMGMTMTPHDIVQANTYSKSILRVCAQALADRYEFVDYFPSYEMAVNSPPAITWHADRLHVREEAVAFIVGHFVESYVDQSPSAQVA